MEPIEQTEVSELKYGKQIVRLSPKGNAITEWEYDGTPVFLPQQILVEKGEGYVRGGSHPCFPNFGEVIPSLGEYDLPRHGYLRKTSENSGEFISRGVEVRDQKAGISGLVVVSRRARYMHAADSIFNYNLTAYSEVVVFGQGVRQSLAICHETDEPKGLNKKIPVGPGFHPYLSSPKGEAIIEIGEKRYSFSKENASVEEIIPMTDFSSAWRSGMSDITITINGLGTVRMLLQGFADSDCGGIVLWRGSNSYICVEPVACLPEYFGTPQGLIFSSKKKKMEFGCTYLFTPEH